MQLTLLFFTIPLLFFIEWSFSLFAIVVGLGLFRFIPWSLVNIYKGHYQDTAHQASSNFTMLENFAGPFGALFVYGIYGYFQNNNISIFWHFLTPSIGLFLLWALRAKDEKISKEMLLIIFLQALVVCAEIIIVIICKNMMIDFINLPSMIDKLNFDKSILVFMIIIGISSLFLATFFLKDIINDAKKGVGRKGLRIGFLYAIHDVFYFIAFAFFGPIFIVARRGLLVPLQNLYINLKQGANLLYLIKQPFKEPLLNLKGGKDFIISFTDLIFNRVVNKIIG